MPFNVCGVITCTCCLGIPTGKSPVESDQTNVETYLRYRHTQLFGSQIFRQRAASLKIFC